MLNNTSFLRDFLFRIIRSKNKIKKIKEKEKKKKRKLNQTLNTIK